MHGDSDGAYVQSESGVDFDDVDDEHVDVVDDTHNDLDDGGINGDDDERLF